MWTARPFILTASIFIILDWVTHGWWVQGAEQGKCAINTVHSNNQCSFSPARYNLISHTAEQRGGCVLLLREWPAGKKKKDLQWILKRLEWKNQVEEFSYFFSQTKRVESFLPLFREQNDLESNEGTEYFKNCQQNTSLSMHTFVRNYECNSFPIQHSTCFFSFEAILHLNVINGGGWADRVE